MPPKGHSDFQGPKRRTVDESTPDDIRQRASDRITHLKRAIESAKNTIKESTDELAFWERVK